ncbi:hypothetical protein PsYK624_032260 [Phanerochaete sordida]|uniref:Mediator complex subunit 16 C-terminal domain-containing protein n=1 Tax=Phanerochaete sordida TaxID=48140 RepID=A0A9P3G2M8_9APHY|nr:hypothetical protein PsYK624_032260 [Phanerochaete sordida]
MQDSQSSKGKAREEPHWQLGWWELTPLVDGLKKPIVWSRSSVIYAAHPTQPTVTARHFPSSRQFIVPWPQPIANNPAVYEPPTVIAVSPAEDWLFAYSPGQGKDGVGCIWKRGDQLESWAIHEYFTYSKYTGVVSAEWISSERSWMVGDHGVPFRLPLRGPTLVDGPALFLVTESHEVHIHCTTLSKPFKGSLLSPSRPTPTLNSYDDPANGSTPSRQEDKADRYGGRRICVQASIGLCHNDPFVAVAIRSKLLPPADVNGPPRDDIGLDISLDMPSTSAQPDTDGAAEWERWGGEETINITFVALKMGPGMLAVYVRPLPTPDSLKVPVSDMRFFAFPPEITPPSPTITRDPRRPAKSNGMSEHGSLFLAVSYLDFDDFSSLPKSHLSLYSFSEPMQRTCRLEHTRTFDSGVLAFLAPAPARLRIIAGFLDSTGLNPRHTGKHKEIRIGSTSVLSIPDLKSDPQWETSPLLCPADGMGRDVPVGISVSPNQTYICSISSTPSILQGPRVSVQPIPHSLPPTQGSLVSTPGRHELSRALISAILSRRSPSDVIRSLSPPMVLIPAVEMILFETATALEACTNGLQQAWYDELLGVMTEIYLARSQAEDEESSKRALTARWKTAHDMCSVVALNSAFDDCRDGDAYDLDAVWQLVGLSRWLVSLLERLLVRCVYVGDPEVSSKPSSAPGTPGKSSTEIDVWLSPDASILLHLLHPYALQNLRDAIAHVRRFRDELDPLPPKGESAQIAKDILMDAADSSGVDLQKLLSTLDEIKNMLKYSAEEQRRCLIKCSLLPSSIPVIRGAVEKILSSSIIDRPKLFIKPSELVDGVTRLSLSDRLKDRDTDVVSKGLLLHPGLDVVCMRCGGRSEVGSSQVTGHVSQNWRAWEQTWASRCVCGGGWMRVSVL